MLSLGNVYVTIGIGEQMDLETSFAEFVKFCLARYCYGDFGDMCEEDLEQNRIAIERGNRILASYDIPDYVESGTEDKVWIVTEWDRSCTTILFPSEY